MTSEEFLKLLEPVVYNNVMVNNPYKADISQGDLDKIIEDNKIDPTDAINWLLDSGLYMSDEGHNGFFCPTLRAKFVYGES